MPMSPRGLTANKSIDTDTQVLACLRHARFLCADHLQR
jgi:hypothetical protein